MVYNYETCETRQRDYAERNPPWRNMLLIQAAAREKEQTIMETAPK